MAIQLGGGLNYPRLLWMPLQPRNRILSDVIGLACVLERAWKDSETQRFTGLSPDSCDSALQIASAQTPYDFSGLLGGECIDSVFLIRSAMINSDSRADGLSPSPSTGYGSTCRKGERETKRGRRRQYLLSPWF